MSHEESDSSITSSGSSLRSELSGEIVIPGPNNKKHFFDYPKNVDLVLNSFYAGCVILAAIGLSAQFFHFPYHPHSAFHANKAFHETGAFEAGGFETVIPGFYCLYGFVACTVLVICATQLRKILMRREDYYDVQ